LDGEKDQQVYTSGDIQNECLQVMALHILRQISSAIAKNGFFQLWQMRAQMLPTMNGLLSVYVG